MWKSSQNLPLATFGSERVNLLCERAGYHLSIEGTYERGNFSVKNGI